MERALNVRGQSIVPALERNDIGTEIVPKNTCQP